MTDREKLIAKIKALLSMTVANGCTEAEAMVALGKARKLMDEYDLSAADLAFNGEGVEADTIYKPDWDRIRDRLAPEIGPFCNCKAWGTRGRSGEQTFCGLKSDMIFAHWLLDCLGDFILREVERYAETKETGRLLRRERDGFIAGCVDRIVTRLRELRPPSTGRDLVVTRNALIDAYLAENDIRLREPFKLDRHDIEARFAGHDAGNRASFNKPVESGEGPRLLK